MAEKWFRQTSIPRILWEHAEHASSSALTSDGTTQAVHVYTEAEHEEVQKLRALYRFARGEHAIPNWYSGIAAALDAIDGGTYNPRIGGENV